MFTLFRHATRRDSLYVDAPAFVSAFVVAEIFYKFHSFALECLAFLVTWLVLSVCLFVLLKPWLKTETPVVPATR